MYKITGAMLRRLAFLAILLYFLYVGFKGITTLGISHDEGQRGLATLDILRFRDFPLMREYYCGAVVSYLQIPFFLLLGPTVLAIRSAQVVFSLASIICVYYVCKRWFNAWVGLTAALLLAINPVFIWSTRLGAEREEILQIFLFWAGLALIQLYLDKRKKRYLYGGFFSFGLALSAKIMFLGYMAGVAAAILFLGRKAFNFIGKEIFAQKYSFRGSLISFLAGTFFIIAYNITSKGATVVTLWKSLLFKSSAVTFGDRFGTNNLDLIHNLGRRYADFRSLLTDTHFVNFQNNLNPVLFGLSLLVIAAYLFFIKKPVLSKNKLIFLIGVYFILFLTTAFTPREYNHANIIILFPIAQIMIAVGVYLAAGIFKNKILIALVSLAILAPAVFTEVSLDRAYLRRIQATGGEGEYSNAVYALGNYLKANNIKKNIFSVGEWGPIGNVNFLLQERVVEPLPYFRSWQEDPDSKFRAFSERNKEAYFIQVIEWGAENGNRDFELLRESALRNNKKITEVKLFMNRAGKPWFGLYKLEPLPAK